MSIWISLDISLERNFTPAHQAVAEGFMLFGQDPQGWIGFKIPRLARIPLPGLPLGLGGPICPCGWASMRILISIRG